jgi:RHS repeat-associated protein
MRTGAGVKFLLGDHLGSTSVTALASGAFDTETRYYPWGGVRWSSGVSPTDYQFTGQQSMASIGLYFYNARWYDSALGRFVQADSIIPNPGDPVAWDRYSYVRNSPLRYVDPTGHRTCTDEQAATGDETCDQNITEEDNILLPPAPPPDELLQPGYEWWLVTEYGVLTYYYTPRITSDEAGLSANPNDWTGDLYNESRLQGSVIVDGVLWKYGGGRFVQQSFCSNGGVPVGYGCLSKPVVIGQTEDGRPIYSVGGAVAACPPGGGGTNACGTPGFNPAFQQGGPPLYVNVPGDSRNPGYVLVVNPIDSGGRLGETQIDIYAGIGLAWRYQFNNPYTIWRQVPGNFINSHGAQ